MNPVERLRSAPRCRATSKRTRMPCQAPAVRGWKVCRCHGAGGGAPEGERNGRYVHGFYTMGAIEERRIRAALISQAIQFLHESKQI
jgi:hypothetical protein